MAFLCVVKMATQHTFIIYDLVAQMCAVKLLKYK
nr:MAG TPA: hypothetical protein [Caudoviricetes sp.]